MDHQYRENGARNSGVLDRFILRSWPSIKAVMAGF